MGKVVLLITLCVWSHLAVPSDGACTVGDIGALQTTPIDITKLDGHWYVTHVFDNTSGDTSSDTSYTVDVVPTLQGITIYSSRNVSGGDCEYRAAELNTTTDSTRFISFSSSSGNFATGVVVASDDENFALLYFCGGDVSGTDNCQNSKAWAMGRQRNIRTAAAWLQSLSTSLPCFESASPLQIQQGSQECPFKPMWGLSGRDCNVDTFPVQENFDINKYVGVWWEMAWLAQFYIPKNELFIDYRHKYVLNNDGNVTADIAGRTPTDKKCFFNTVNVFMTDTPGRMIFNESSGPTPYNVVMVDYERYAVVFGCRERNDTTGECVSARSWLWSRNVTLDRQSRLAANSLFQRLCVNPATFLSTEQSNECKEDTGTGGGSALSSTVFLTSLLTLVSLSI